MDKIQSVEMVIWKQEKLRHSQDLMALEMVTIIIEICSIVRNTPETAKYYYYYYYYYSCFE